MHLPETDHISEDRCTYHYHLSSTICSLEDKEDKKWFHLFAENDRRPKILDGTCQSWTIQMEAMPHEQV